MGEYDMYTTYRGKLIDLCEENDLTCSLNCTNDPCTLTIRPVGGIDAQISMLEAVEHQGYTSPDASIAMCYIDGEIRVEVHGIFAIADAILSKIKRLFANSYSAYTQYFSRDAMERGALRTGMMPTIERDNPSDEPDEDAPDDNTAGGGRRPASLGRM